MILDLYLNSESGLEFIKEVTKRYPKVKTVVYSMYENAGIVALALEYGAKGYVCKSSEEKELFTAIKRVSEGESYIQSALVQPLIVYHSLLESFTKKEAAVIKKAVENKPNELIAKELSISVRTVENYLSRIYEKTGCQSRSDLATSLMNLCQSMNGQAGENGAKVEIRLVEDGEIDTSFLSEEAKLNLYRITQESLMNVLKHAEASEAIILIRNALENEVEGIYIFISDDGKGFDTEKPVSQGHFGLAGMEERARLIGAKLKITSAPGEGMQVAVSL